MAVIYKATNKNNNKSYIGFAINFKERVGEHLRKSKRKDRQYFHNAIAKHGEDAFEWSILKEDATLEDEVYFIELHKTFWIHEKGYNLTMGGEGKLGYITSERTRNKIKMSNKTKEPTEKQLETLRRNAAKMRGIPRTDEAKKRISESLRGRVFSEEHRQNISENHASKKDTGKFYQSEEYKDKMSKSLKGKTRTLEQKERYRMAAKGRTEETKRKMLEARKRTYSEKMRLKKLKEDERRIVQGF
jgi:group I intron endonuclease